MANSTTNQTSNTVQKNNQNTSTSGGSSSSTHSSTTGGSETTTLGYGVSNSNTSTQGGSHSVSNTAGKTWASGQVSDQTQAQFNKYNQDYQQSQAVSDAYSALQQAISGKPTFQSQYESNLQNMYEQIMNRGKFSYNFNEDAMYNLYKDQYSQMGQQAMQDTMGQAASLTGGYGSSYAQTAGQQTYQNYLQQVNNMIPELRNQAYQEYQDEGNELLQKYNVTSDAYAREYGQYRDSMSDWQSDRSFDYGMYSDERNYDLSKYQSDRNYWQNQYWAERNAEQSSASQSVADATNWSKSNTTSQNWSWQNSQNNFWQNTDSTTNSTNWSNSSTNGTTTTDTSSNSSSVSTPSGGSGSGSNGGKAEPKYTANWSHNSSNGGVSSSDLVQDLYYIYKNEGDQGVNNALSQLKKDGLPVGDTRYTMTTKDVQDLAAELRSTLDNIYRNSGQKAGASYSTWLKK